MRSRVKRLLSIAAASVALIFLSATPAYAALTDPFNSVCQNATGSTVCADAQEPQTVRDNRLFGPRGVVRNVIALVSIVIGIASVIMMLLGSLKIVMANGDSSKVASGKRTIIYAVGGVLIALFAQAMVLFVFRRL